MVKEREIDFKQPTRSAPPLSKEGMDLLQRLYYKDGLIFGRDKLYKYIQDNHPNVRVSRRQVADWLKLQEINQLHKPRYRAKDIKSNVMSSPHKQIGLDLVDLQNFEVKGHKYLLNAVDLFSRKLYSVALKDKTDKTVLSGFKKIHNKMKDLSSVRSDNGSEFIAKVFQDYLNKNNIKQVLSKASNPQSNGAIERANQTLKWLIQKHIEMTDGYDWVKNLGKLVGNINKTIHEETGKTPDEIETEYAKKNDEFIQQSYEKQQKKKSGKMSKQKFEVGDNVRIYQPSDKIKSRKWSQEIYEIDKVFKPKKPWAVYEYKVSEFSNKFKEEDLQLVDGVMNKLNQPKLYEISKIVKPVVRANEPHYEVLWKGYRQTTVEPRKQLLKDVPKMVNLFEKRNDVVWKRDRNKRLYLA